MQSKRAVGILGIMGSGARGVLLVSTAIVSTAIASTAVLGCGGAGRPAPKVVEAPKGPPPQVAEPSTCEQRHGTYRFELLEQSGGTCGPAPASTSFVAEQPTTVNAPCKGYIHYSADNCVVTFRTECPVQGSNGTRFREEHGVASWSRDGSHGSGVLFRDVFRNDGRALCSSAYDIVDTRGAEPAASTAPTVTCPPGTAWTGETCEGAPTVACPDPAACVAKGMDILDQGADVRRAIPYFRATCTESVGDGCDLLGTAYMTGEGVPQDPAAGFKFFSRGCDHGNMLACSNLAKAYDFGQGVAKDPARAAALYQKACDGNVRGACFNLGVGYANGDGVAKDPVRAAHLYEKACAAGDAGGCYNLSRAYYEGQGVTMDRTAAFSLARKACDLKDAKACKHVGEAFETGLGATRNLEAAEHFYDLACRLGEEPGCANVKRLQSAPRFPTRPSTPTRQL